MSGITGKPTTITLSVEWSGEPRDLVVPIKRITSVEAWSEGLCIVILRKPKETRKVYDSLDRIRHMMEMGL